MNLIQPDHFEEVETDVDGWDVGVVQGAVFECGGSSRHGVTVGLDRCHLDRTAGEPWPMELLEGWPPRNECSDTGGVAKHLVERQGNIVRMVATQVEPIGRHEGGGIEEHVPTAILSPLDPLQWMLNSGEVRLGWKGEEVVATLLGEAPGGVQQRFRDPHLRRSDRNIGGPRPVGPVEFADAVDRVVIVEGQEELVPGLEGIGLSYQLQSVARIGGEDDAVLTGRSVEELENVLPRLLDERGCSE